MTLTRPVPLSLNSYRGMPLIAGMTRSGNNGELRERGWRDSPAGCPRGSGWGQARSPTFLSVDSRLSLLGRWWLVLPVRAGNDGIRVRDGNPAPRGWQGREVVGRWAVAFRYSKQDNLQVRRDGCVLHRKWIGLDGKSENGG